jgi:hypothetical protein
MLTPQGSPVEIFIAIHVVDSSTLEQNLGSNEDHESGKVMKQRKIVLEALQKKRAVIFSGEKIAIEKATEASEATMSNVDITTTTTTSSFTPAAAVEGDGIERAERLKKSLVAHLEQSVPGKVLSAYFITFNELFALGQHLAATGARGAERGPSIFFSKTAPGSSRRRSTSISTAENTTFLPNTLIFDFFDGEYGAFPWPIKELESVHEPTLKAFSNTGAARSAAPSKEPSPFPSPRRDDTTAVLAAAVEEESTSDVQVIEEDTAPAGGVVDELNEESAAAAAAAAAASSSLGLGSMLMSRLRGSAPTVTGEESTSSTTTPSNDTGGNGVVNNNINNNLGLRGIKVVPVDKLKDQIESILTLQARIQHLSTRCKESQTRIDTILEQQAPARQQHAELQSYDDKKIKLTREHTIMSQRAEEALKRALLAEKSATVTSQALISTLQALQSAHKRISAGETSLNGEEGRGRLTMALKELIARRCLMTVQLGWILRLGPATMRMPMTPPGGLLDSQLEKQWAGRSTSNSGGGGDREAVGAKNNVLRSEEIRLAICGLGLDSSVWAHAFDPGGYDWDPVQDKAASVALGYCALLINKLSEYLGIVLRYPIIYRGSVSVVMDNYPQAGSWKPEPATRGGAGRGAVSGAAEAMSLATSNFLFSRAPAQDARHELNNGESSSSSTSSPSIPTMPVTPVEYPLYCLSNKERPKFAVGVFLLNKNAIQLLQAHGISAAGPSQLLQNVHKLIAAAQSGIPQGLGSGYWK